MEIVIKINKERQKNNHNLNVRIIESNNKMIFSI